jgi:hypothetical protein
LGDPDDRLFHPQRQLGERVDDVGLRAADGAFGCGREDQSERDERGADEQP